MLQTPKAMPSPPQEESVLVQSVDVAKPVFEIPSVLLEGVPRIN